MIPTGMLMKKIQRQPKCSTRRPPVTGPNTGASTIGTPTMLRMRPIRCGPAARARMIIPVGISMPPPRPWRTRNAISELVDQAKPQSSEPSVKRTSEIR